MVTDKKSNIIKFTFLFVGITGALMLLPFNLLMDWYLRSTHYMPPADANIEVVLWLNTHIYINKTTYLIREYMQPVGFLLAAFGLTLYNRMNQHK